MRLNFANRSIRTLVLFVSTLGLWQIAMVALSINVNLYPESWEARTLSWGYARFRDWGDQFFLSSLVGAMALFSVIWLALEFYYSRRPRKLRA